MNQFTLDEKGIKTLIDLAIEQIKRDIKIGDLTSLEVMLQNVSPPMLLSSLSDELCQEYLDKRLESEK